MSCEQLRTRVAAYADGEVNVSAGKSIIRHMHRCGDCAVAYRDILDLRTRIRVETQRFGAPVTLHARVRALAVVHASEPRTYRPIADRLRWLSGGLLAGCMASLVAWLCGTTMLASLANQDFAVAAVARHIERTLDARLVEVASSDRHTVKPWLSGRLDYSPPVQDLSAEGFPLIGGRLEYIDAQPVATLVYRYRQHTIDVFVRPRGAGAPPPAFRTLRGFNVAYVGGPTMQWFVVSDAEPAALRAFAGLLSREYTSP